MSEETILQLWGKTKAGSNDPNEYHPALFHMIDVAYVAKALLGKDASPRWRRVLSKVFGVPEDCLQGWVPWAIALHDIGKISAPFQSQLEQQKKRLLTQGFDFGKEKWDRGLSHGEVSELFIRLHFGMNSPKRLLRAMSDSAGGHHGFFTKPTKLQENKVLLAQEPAMWGALRTEASKMLADLLLKQEFPLSDPQNVSTAVMALTGFTILCDWLGSNRDYFTPQTGVSLEKYKITSEQQACRAVEAAGFFQQSFSASPVEFPELFPEKSPPRPLQLAIDQIPIDVLSRPCLAIIEAPTGEGKTEAALALAHRIAGDNKSDEFYYALPTTATSNQMFLRLQHYLDENLDMGNLVKLVHGQAFLYEDDLRIRSIEDRDNDYSDAMEWFAPKKRSLLASFGVGTIDQAELAVLNVKHVPLRMMGLAGKILIIDEVHAYDVYMTTIIESLLKWLSEMGTSVILLSATLPIEKRDRLIDAYCGKITIDPTMDNAYPSLWVVGQAGTFHDTPPAYQLDRSITLHANELHFEEDLFEEKARWLLNAVSTGGCVCWIVNTVARAQGLFLAIKSLASEDIDCSILHAQFPLDVRQILEQKITHKYGPGDIDRPKRGIVIGTQVLEQSLDLDFDVMVSDLAPIDLLLQRAGRLQRHNRPRPSQHREPHFLLNTTIQDGNLNIGVDGFIYSEFILRKTWEAVRRCNLITLPADYRPLIENVYGQFKPEDDHGLAEAWRNMQAEHSKETQQARQRLLEYPNPDDAFSGSASQYSFKEDEEDTHWNVARTRLGEESLTVIPLERTGNKVHFEVDGVSYDLDLSLTIPREMQLQLLRKSVRVSNRKAVEALKEIAEANIYPSWNCSLLKYSQPLFLENGKKELTYKSNVIRFFLDPQVGLVIKIVKGG